MARILIIDDYRPVLTLLEEMLSREGHTVILAAGGQAGLDLARATRVDLALVDIDMPRMDGFSVCRTLRSCIDPAPPVLLMTGRLLNNTVSEGMVAGAYGVVEKPFDHGILLSELARGLQLALA